MNYKEAGVDVQLGNQFVQKLNAIIQPTLNSKVLSQLGAYGSYYNINNISIQNPVLVASTDGVGSKLLLALKQKKLNTIGIDLVAMVANDIVCSGAQPAFFLDYYATNRLDLEISMEIMNGIQEGCIKANMVLIGGETAEMPSLYQPGHFDLAGFGVGIVDKYRITSSKNVNVGDTVIGIRSSGPHSNGYALINNLIENAKRYNVTSEDLVEIITQSLSPTKIYVDTVLSVISEIDVNGIAHITGGGLLNNIPRVLPYGVNAHLKLQSWSTPNVFKLIQYYLNLSDDEMYNTFNMGIGMVLIVHPEDVNDTIKILTNSGEQGVVIGDIIKSAGEPKVFLIK